uniref:non-specific serine/threonine protein kinase n=1 Tax=Anthurium amnicola TaxID=1678845 RepID=A0A1D1Y7G3_9ARAE
MSGQHSDDVENKKAPLEKVQVDNSPTYITGHRLGKGGFGVVYVGARTGTSDQVAIKFERINGEVSQSKKPNEWKAYEALSEIPGVPRIHYKGQQKGYHVLIMDFLGPSLRDCQDIVSVDWVKDIAIQTIKILKDVHSIGYVHGDIKPNNLLFDSCGTSNRKLFLVDFGLATRWKKDSGQHVEYDQQPNIFRGTAEYASVHTHLGRTHSRRDDLESLAYTLIFLLRGSLLLKELEEENKDKVHRCFLVCKRKMSLSPEELCSSLPQCFRKFFEYVVGLKFDEKPKYKRCISLFKGIRDPEKPISAVDVEQEAEHIRTGKPATQWISVYDARQPMKQRYHYNVTDENLKYFIEKGKEEKLFISSVASFNNLWALIIDAGTGFSDQVYKSSSSFHNEEWIKEQWKEHYYITAIAGRDDGSSLIVMSKGTQYKQQDYNVYDSFTFTPIKEIRGEDFYVTSMATAGTGSQWAVVMSRSDVTLGQDQVVELDFRYPYEGIHRRWENGFQITATAATPDQAAFIFTGPRNPQGLQVTYRSSNFPSQNIKKEWDRNMYVTSICYGRTIS